MFNNENISLKNLFNYIVKVFEIGKEIEMLPEQRKRVGVKTTTAILMVIVGFIMQKPSFYQIFTQSNFSKRMGNLFKKGTNIPQVDCVRKILEKMPVEKIKNIQIKIIKKIRKNKTFINGTIDGLTVVAIDGVELFSSDKKCCKECLTRVRKDGKTEYFHRSVVAMTVGCDPHVILGEDFLKPRDGSEKDEGELTGGKRLIDNLYKNFKHFADVIVCDALYLNAPFINTVLSKRIDIVIRAKDETRLILQDALGLIKNKRSTGKFSIKNGEVEFWDEKGFLMDGVKEELRFFQFVERKYNVKDKTKIKTRTIWVFTTLETTAKTVYTIMCKRWDIENNGFHQLKTYYNADHCFEHRAVENIFLLNIIAFNFREMYLFKHIHDFRAMKQTRINVTQNWSDDLLQDDLSKCFCFNDSG